MEATPVRVNPYIQIDYQEKPVDSAMLQKYITDMTTASQEDLSSGAWAITIKPYDVFELDQSHVSLIVTHNESLWSAIDQYVEDDLRGTMREVSVKQKQRLMHELLSDLTDASMDLNESIADWQSLLKAYLVKKYGQDHEAYISVLRSLDILS